ncbi:MAG TPA: nucleotide-binding protein [Thermoanaerobaculia bacterium]
MKRRIFVSSPRDEYLDDRRNKLKWAIVGEIEALGYEAQVFGSPEGGKGLAADRSWSAENAKDVMRRCVGAAILGFPIWKCSAVRDSRSVSLVTEYCHYEGALARAFGLPILALLEEGVEERVFFARHATDPVITVPVQADYTWVAQDRFRGFLERWNKNLGERKDLFLAYSGRLEGTADSIRNILNQIGATVLDWKPDFVGGSTILEQVERAAERTTGGVFLFTRDDMLKGKREQAAPRDNVIFEAGFFAHAKGHERVLIIREEGAKMPADLGGVVYETLADRSNTSGLEERLRRFVEAAI